MSNQIKIRSTQPNNHIRGALEGIPVSRLYQEKTNQMLPMETLSVSNDVNFSLNTYAKNSEPVIRINTHYRTIHKAVLELKLASDVPQTNDIDYLAHNFVRRISYRYPGAERMDIHPWTAITTALNSLDDNEKREQYRNLNGRAYKKYSSGTTLYMIIPIPGIDMSSDDRYKQFPIPLHMVGEPLELTFQFGDELTLSSAKVHICYGDLAYTSEYKNSTYRYQFKASYGYQYPVQPVSSRKGVRSVNLLGFRPGETNEIIVHYAPKALTTPELQVSGTGAETTFPKFWALREGAVNSLKYSYGARLRGLKLYYLNTLIWDLDAKRHELYDVWQSKKQTKFCDNYGFVDNVSYTVSGATTSVVAAGHNSGVGGTGVRVNAVADGSQTTNTGWDIPSADGFAREDEKPFQIGSYYYKIPISEKLTEFTQNGYSLGSDFTHATLRLEFYVDSEEDDVVRAPNSISHAEAEDLSAGTLYCTQLVQSVYQYMGSTVSLIQ